MGILLAAVLLLTALILDPLHSFYFDVTPKIVVLLAGTGIALILASLSSRAASFRPRLVAAFGALAAIAVFSLVTSASLSPNSALSFYGTSWRRFGVVGQFGVLLFAWLVAAACAARPERARLVLGGISAAGALSAVYGIGQYFGWDAILPASAYRVGEGVWQIVRPPGTMGHAGYFANWLVMAAFVSLAVKPRWVPAALCAICVFFTGSRAGMLGLAAGGAIYVAWTRPRFSRRAAAAVCLFLLAAAGFYYSPAGQPLRGRTRWFVEDPLGGARLWLWRDSLRMAAARLPAGYGPEVFEANFPRFESVELAQAYPDFTHESPHNMFLDSLVAQGIPGFAALCGFCALGFFAAARLRKHQAQTAAALAAALGGGIVSQQFTVFTLPTALAFFTIAALAVALASQWDKLPSKLTTRQAWRPVPLIVALALLILAARFAVADYHLAMTRRAIDAHNVRSAVESYARYDRWRLPGTAADLWYSRSLRNLAQQRPNPIGIAQSSVAARRATTTAEAPFNAWYNLAAFYAAGGDAVNTERSLRAAIAAHPRWFKPHWTLARLLQAESRAEEAEREAALAAQLDGGRNPEVADTLVAIRNAVSGVNSRSGSWRAR